MNKKQHSIMLSVNRCAKLGPGYPVQVGCYNIEWHDLEGNWRDTFNTGNNHHAAKVEALYKLCEANGWTVNLKDTRSSDPREQYHPTQESYDAACAETVRIRKQPPHPDAQLFIDKYITLS